MTDTSRLKKAMAKGGIEPVNGASPAAPARSWPELDPAAMYGLPGRIVRTVEPHTEADVAAMLFSLYAAAGAMIGNRPHIYAGAVEHGPRVWPLIIGGTGSGVKGTSWAEMKRVTKAADMAFHVGQVVSGISSAEGLIQQVRDGSGTAPDAPGFDEGVGDKRLLIIETEFAAVLAQGKREGNTVLPMIRQAWDGDTLRTMTKNACVATEPHIVIIGHITPTELRKKLSESERAGGTMNRFMPVLSRRSKKLPSGGQLADEDVYALGRELADVVERASKVGRMKRTTEANEYWVDLYDRLTSDVGDGPVAEVIARGAPQMLRLSVTTALLDGANAVDLRHLQAAEAMWNYVEDSAWHVFGSGTGNPDFDRLAAYVDAAGHQGVTRTDITKVCFGGHRKKDQIDALLASLVSLDDYTEYSTPTAGRSVKSYRRNKRN